MLNAWAFAAQVGMPLNVKVTIHWGWLRIVSEKSAKERLRLFLHRLGNWLRRQGVPLVYIWVHEVAPGTGLHTHIVLSVGATARELIATALSQKAPEFLIGEDGELPPDNAVMVSRSRYLPSRIARTDPQLRGKIAYLLKGADAATAALIGIEPNPRKAGTVQRRRVCVAHSIGPTARAGTDWHERGLEEFDLGFTGHEAPRRSYSPWKALQRPASAQGAQKPIQGSPSSHAPLQATDAPAAPIG